MVAFDGKASWDFPPDAREKGLEYPNYNIIGSLAGHNITLDDTKGAESLTISHGTGSAMQFRPDGSISIKSNGSRYTVILGDDLIMVSGAHDVTVNGAKTLKVVGDFITNVTGNMKTVVGGNYEMLVAGKYGEHIEGDMSTTISGSKTTYVDGSILQSSTDRTHILAKAGMKLQTTGGHLYAQSSGDMKLYAQGAMAQQSDGAMSVKSGATYTMSARGLTTLKGGSQMGLDAGQIFLNSGLAGEAGNA